MTKKSSTHAVHVLFLFPQHPSILTSFRASAQCPHSWAHMVSSSCQVSRGAGAQIARRWPPTQGELPVVDTEAAGRRFRGSGIQQTLCNAVCCLCSPVLPPMITSEAKHAEMNRQISVYTWMAIAKRVSDCRIGIIQLTLEFKFAILATLETVTEALNLQISEAFSIPFPFKRAKFPLSIQNSYIHISLISLIFSACSTFNSQGDGSGQDTGRPIYGRFFFFTSIQRRAGGGQARPQMDSV